MILINLNLLQFNPINSTIEYLFWLQMPPIGAVPITPDLVAGAELMTESHISILKIKI
jgi:hypothetical protein